MASSCEQNLPEVSDMSVEDLKKELDNRKWPRPQKGRKELERVLVEARASQTAQTAQTAQATGPTQESNQPTAS